jgi:predicted nucleic acid-binding protein
MPVDQPPSCVVVTDASVLINLMHVGRLPLMATALGYRLVMPQEVDLEITDSAQRAIVDAGCACGYLRVDALTDPVGIAVFAQLARRFGRGESACLAMAEVKGWALATDEGRRFRREAEARLGARRVLGTVELFVAAIRAGRLTVAGADADKATLAGRRFRMPFASFGDIT